MFQFKEFRIEQDRCAMKVGTDSILLGAWAKVHLSGKLLDIGAGTGILSLMMAQRSKMIQIDAVELDPVAAEQCEENVQNSPWRDRIRVYAQDIHNFFPSYSYEHIISNPPFFSQDLLASDPARMLARQGHNLDIAQLLAQIHRLLGAEGICALIVPSSHLSVCLEESKARNFFIQRLCFVKPVPQKEPHRVLLSLTKRKYETVEEQIIIQTGSANEYSSAYRALTADFYLNNST